MKKRLTGNERNNFLKFLTVYFLVLVALVLNITGCGSQPTNPEPKQVYDCHKPFGDFKDYYVGESLPGIQKIGKPIQCVPESTPVVWNNQVLIVGASEILDFESHEVVAKFKQGGIFASALVVGDTLYSFQTDSPRIIMSSTKDLITWTPWEPIFQIDIAYSHQVYNTSVIKTVDGFVMAYEVDGEPGQSGYSWNVALGATLKTMVRVSQIFSLDYSACPSVKYVDGWYQFLYLEGYNHVLVTRVARTKDFITYEKSDKLFLAPAAGEGRNNSDADMIEFNGKVYIVYMDGNQAGWDDQRTAIYNGTMSEMFEQIWE